MVKRLIHPIKRTTLKNKIFFSTTAVTLMLSVVIALFTRWMLISSLTSELKERGIGISYSIAESSRGFILTEDTPQLISLIFDARLGVRKKILDYVYITDKQGNVLAHTFTIDFPQVLKRHNEVPIPPENPHTVSELHLGDKIVYDVAVPVNEGIYRIGSVHVGVKKQHIDHLIEKLRTTFLGFASAVTLLFFIISHYLAKYITRPISELTTLSDEISRGNFEIDHTHLPPLSLPVQAEAKADKDERDEVQQLSLSFMKMTQRIMDSRKKLQESESKYRSLFVGGPNPIFVLDRQHLTILSANPSAEKTYGISRENLLGTPITNLGPFELDEIQRPDFQRRHTGKVKTVDSKVQCITKDGSPLYVNVHACPVRYQEKDAVILATTDITKMVEKDNQLIQASKMTTLGEMSAGIAHELNQPLNAIKMGNEFIDMMIETGKKIPDAKLAKVVKEVSSQVDRAVDIIRRLRDFGRKADFTKEKVTINQPVQSVLEIIGKQLKLQNIEIQLNLDAGIPPILAHRNRIEQVIFNLLTNARDAINQKRESGENRGAGDDYRILIETFTRENQVMVVVKDTGLGIDIAVKKRMFEAFFTTKQMGEGMGLGLSITNGIVEDYGGRINIESAQGEGTTFRLSFPAAA